MEVGRFRRFAGLRCPWALVILLACVWYAQSVGWGEVPGDDGEDPIAPSIAVKYVDRELLLLETGRDSHWFLSWWTGDDERLEVLEGLASVLQKAEQEDSVYLAQLEVERLLILERNKEAEEVEVPEWLTKEMVDEGMANGYLGESAISLYLSSTDDQKLSLELKERGKLLLWRSFVFGTVFLGSIVGSVFAVVYLVRRRSEGGIRWRVVKMWDVSLILTVFFLAEIIGGVLSDYLFSPIIYEYGDYRLGPILDELIWRGLGTLIAVAFLTGRVSAAVRIYGLNQPVNWRPLLAVMVCLFAFDWIYFITVDHSRVVDPTDFFLVAFPDKIDLFHDVVNSVVAAPVFEELMFRGVLFMGLLSRIGAIRAAVLSSLLFAIVHTQYDLMSLVSMLIFGLACCWLVWKTGSLKTGIVLHMLYNAILTADVYLFYQRPL